MLKHNPHNVSNTHGLTPHNLQYIVGYINVVIVMLRIPMFLQRQQCTTSPFSSAFKPFHNSPLSHEDIFYCIQALLFGSFLGRSIAWSVYVYICNRIPDSHTCMHCRTYYLFFQRFQIPLSTSGIHRVCLIWFACSDMLC